MHLKVKSKRRGDSGSIILCYCANFSFLKKKRKGGSIDVAKLHPEAKCFYN
jgi:hypothetical protein